jgi:hypothetical protein
MFLKLISASPLVNSSLVVGAILDIKIHEKMSYW